MPERSRSSSDERLAEAALAELPPRDDEPASLWQDILDELRDHLACASRSELLRTNGDTPLMPHAASRKATTKNEIDCKRRAVMSFSVKLGIPAGIVSSSRDIAVVRERGAKTWK